MKKFIDKTTSGNENSVKKINNLPSDNSSFSLGYVSSGDISPANTLLITDFSSLISENNNISISNNSIYNEGQKIFYADELGILQDSEGNSLFSSPELMVSDLPLLDPYLDERKLTQDLDPENFVFSYYISKNYTLIDKDLYSYDSLKDYIPQEKIPSSIIVVNKNGEEYTDKSNGKKKYRILLDQITLDEVDVQLARPETLRPHRIVVLLPDAKDEDLYLTYDMTMISSDKTFSQTKYNHKEKINPLPIFDNEKEESVVADLTSRNKRIYSTKQISSNYNFVNGLNSSIEGYEVFVPKKAISDNRNYQTFNWRLIAKIVNRTNVSSINYQEAITEEDLIRQRTIRCAVLWTSADRSAAEASQNVGYASPYIFNRLQNSPFNLSSYIFENPLAEAGVLKTSYNYWMVNIDNLANLDDFDIVAWSPTSNITVSQAQKIKSFIEDKHGTVFLDLSSPSLNSQSATLIYPYLSMASSSVQMNNWEYNRDNLFINELKTNAWPISDNIFEAVGNQVYYGIFGNAVNSVSGERKYYKYFDNQDLATANIVLKENTNNQNKPIFVSVEYQPVADSLVRGSILATTTPVLKYCNDVYQSSSIFNQAISNSSFSQTDNGQVIPTAVIEGPFKILYNAVSVAMLSKSQASRSLDMRSSTYYMVGNWNSSYVLNGSVLLEDEKSEYSTIPSETNGDLVYSKNIISNYGSIFDYYKRIVYDLLPDQYSLIAQDINKGNIELYIEVTNNNIILNGLNKISNDYFSSEINDIPSSHSLYKVVSSQYDGSIFAHTTVGSASFEIPGGFGPYELREKNILRSSDISGNFVGNKVSANSYKSYPFSFSTYNTYLISNEQPINYDVTWTANVIATGTATLSRRILAKNIPAETRSDSSVKPVQGYSGIDVDDNSIIAALPPDKRISHVKNNFLYTGDIDAGNTHISYKQGRSGLREDYTKYIQYTLANCGISSIKNIQVDGKFGPQTTSYVKIFQSEKGLTWVDGVVDSQTKSYLLRVWKSLAKNNFDKFTSVVDNIRKKDPDVIKYIRKRVNPEVNELHSSDLDYRRISFTYNKGPEGVIKDVVYVRVPKMYNTLKDSSAISNLKVNSITIKAGAFDGATKYKGVKINKILCSPQADADELKRTKNRYCF